MRKLNLFFILIPALLYACTSDSTKQAKYKAPLFDNLGNFKYEISCKSEDAQSFFNQGFVLTYAFNHEEAARSFREAIRLDSTCAMCYWGLAYIYGPNINAAMEDEKLAEVNQAIAKALGLSKNCTQKEKDLIEALSKRYPKEKTADRSAFDLAFAEAMRKVYQKYPKDDEIATITAEALMDLHPWDLWQKDGNPQSWTPEIVDILEKVLARNPAHIGANHLYIHSVEASPNPEKAMKCADTLRTLVPGAGHLIHMPSHIYIRTGRYHEGSISNQKAVIVDSLYITACHAQGLYPLAYYPHNSHFLAATATLEGNSKVAIAAAFETALHTQQGCMKKPGMGTLQHYIMIPHYLLVKFGQWDKILNLPKPEKDLKYPLAIRHYARGMAYLGKKSLKKAESELTKVKEIQKDSSLKTITIWEINSVDVLVKIAALLLEAEITHQKGNSQKAIELLTEAVALEDGLNYNEPPDWFFSIRHHLGAVLLDAGKFAEAEKIYLQDLKSLPENGWALKGLYESLTRQKKNEEAKKVKKRLDEAWKWADISLSSSRIL